MTDKTSDKIMLPEGRVIHHALFEKSIYTNDKGEKGTPRYTLELAFEPSDLAALEDAVIATAIAEWGPDAEQAYLSGDILSPLLDGDKLAKRREAKDKPGDAYKGKVVIRPNTQFNHEGQNAPGGVYVAGPDGKKLPFTDHSKVYNGCYGRAIVSIGTYTDGRGDPALKLWLGGFMLTRDGERLGNVTDYSKMFQPYAVKGKSPAAAPAATAEAPAATGRRRLTRAG